MNRTHSHTSGGKSLTYKSWISLRRRVKRSPYYEGVYVDPAWEDFSCFLSDVGERPSSQHTLDRVDNNLGYTKSNVRWATAKEQSRNRSSNIIVDWTGDKVCLKEACEVLGWGYKVVWSWYRQGKTFAEIESRAIKLWGSND